jgi:cyclopropane fatty-acyl-phospholipid synthase-like methyltransferase
MFDDLVRLTGLAPGDRIIEIGCGTGQASARRSSG